MRSSARPGRGATLTPGGEGTEPVRGVVGGDMAVQCPTFDAEETLRRGPVAEGREASLAPSPPAVPVHLVEEHVLNRKQDQGFLRFWGEFMGVHLWFCKPARPKLHRTEPVPDLEANEFVTKKKAEFAAQIAERDAQIAELTRQLAEATEALAALKAANPLQEPPKTDAQVLEEMAQDI
ncbi:unnamed protein product [Durusdinium trenchii]|uniref:Uncharacterized protein n=1 Tax=Durusdinium trenchii TaxID=1381693 RepID=A0ABP0RGA8_9DINO